jgi:hypothetical protein
MRQHHEHLLVSQPSLVHVVLYTRVAPRQGMLGFPPVEDPRGRVPLLLGLRLSSTEAGSSCATVRTPAPPPGYSSRSLVLLALSVRTLHLVHLLGLPRAQHPFNGLELRCGGLLFDRHKGAFTRWLGYPDSVPAVASAMQQTHAEIAPLRVRYSGIHTNLIICFGLE